MRDPLDDLRQRIRAIEGRPVHPARRVSSGMPLLDEAVGGGLPCPGVVLLEGPAGSGRTRLALHWVAARTRGGERVAWVDPERLLHPPTATALGVDLASLLLVRPDAPRAGWALEQILRSACFGLVVVSGLPRVQGHGPRYLQALRHGACTLVLLADQPDRELLPDLRVVLREGTASVQRRRGGRAGQRFVVPAWPPGLDPWEEGPSWG